jgi:hypothetical protein
MHTTIELLLETLFSTTQSIQSGYKEDNWDGPVSCQLTENELEVQLWREDFVCAVVIVRLL